MGGCIPRPKKLKNDSSSITLGIVSVVYTIIGPIVLGITYLVMIRHFEMPVIMAESMYSFSLMLKTCPLIILAMVSHSTAPMAMKSRNRFLPNTTINNITNIINGRA